MVTDAEGAGTSLILTWAETDGLLASEKLPRYCSSPAPQAPSHWTSWPLLPVGSQSHRNEEGSGLWGRPGMKVLGPSDALGLPALHPVALTSGCFLSPFSSAPVRILLDQPCHYSLDQPHPLLGFPPSQPWE